MKLRTKSKFISTKAAHVSALGMLSLAGCGLLFLQSCTGKTKKPQVLNQDSLSAPSELKSQPEGGIKIAQIPWVAAADGTSMTLPDGRIVPVTTFKGAKYIPVEGALDEKSFKALNLEAGSMHLQGKDAEAFAGQKLTEALNTLAGGENLLAIDVSPKIGYFSALISLKAYESLSSGSASDGELSAEEAGAIKYLTSKIKELKYGMVMNPIFARKFDETLVRKLSDEKDLQEILSDSRTNPNAFSGLNRIGEPALRELLLKEHGIALDGSSVKVGVVDSGTTYNHPTFLGQDGKSRITRMRDFTGEGRIFFTPSGKFEVRNAQDKEIPDDYKNAKDSVLILNADYLDSPYFFLGFYVKPIIENSTQQVKDLPIAVSKELKEILLTAGNGARLGAIFERGFNNADLNQNGKIDDVLFAIFVPGSNGTADRVFFDTSGRGDFRNSVGLADFNVAQQTMPMYSEKVGFEIMDEFVLSIADGRKNIPVKAASIVGYDPGNHGTHVSGIIAGRKTFSNDSSSTLARGLAPNSTLMVNRVCASAGFCVDFSRALEDLAANGAQVVNLSLGGLNDKNDGYAVRDLLINRITEVYNTLFIIAAGNSGPGRQTVASPSVARHALSIGATASRQMIERQYQFPGIGKLSTSNEKDDDFVLFFSSRGPSAAGGFKPNLTAPGTEMSAIQLNSAPGARAGLDVYWGTSMAAPTAAGAATLLLDAAQKYNLKYPDAPVPTDALTLKQALMESARPFDAAHRTPSGVYSPGQYTWIDQGAGMINLEGAWKVLLAARTTQIPSAVKTQNGKSVALDYQVRSVHMNPNGMHYGGTELNGDGANYATGIWLDYNGKDNLFDVEVSRRLTSQYDSHPELGDLHRQLVTTADEFVLESTFYGADKEWIKAGTLDAHDCQGLKVAPTLTLVGQSSITGAPGAIRDSRLKICIDREALRTLPPGDHGALIRAYRIARGSDGSAQKEAMASFIVPVQVTVPHKVIGNGEGYTLNDTVQSFSLRRNYIEVPKGTSYLKVSLEVPDARKDGSGKVECSGAVLFALEGKNTASPKEFQSRAAATAANCGKNGEPTSDKKIVSFKRSNPTPGTWDLHVMGAYQFLQSAYKLTVDFASILGLPSELKTTVAELTQGASFEVKITDKSMTSFPADLLPSMGDSTFMIDSRVMKSSGALEGKVQTLFGVKGNGELRTFAENVGAVTFSTKGTLASATDDIDMTVFMCDKPDITAVADIEKNCRYVKSSLNAGNDESIIVTPTVGKYYATLISSVDSSRKEFEFKESQMLTTGGVKGMLKLSDLSENGYRLSFIALEEELKKSELINTGELARREIGVEGKIVLFSPDKSILAEIPVELKE
jgi:subtilisin family serine protease